MATSYPASEYPGGAKALLERVRQSQGLESLCDGDSELLQRAEVIECRAGEVIFAKDRRVDSVWVLLEGTACAESPQDSLQGAIVRNAVDTLGEMFFVCDKPSTVDVVAKTDSQLLRISGETFWKLTEQCPGMRAGFFSRLLSVALSFQSFAMQQEKMVTIGTMTAGLMHEIKNPGAAAKRATSQLRQNLRSLHQLSLSLSSQVNSDEQQECLNSLLSSIYAQDGGEQNSIDAMDREEEFCRWMDDNNVPDCWKIAPVLAGSGIRLDELECARKVLPPETLSDALHWLEALGSSSEKLQTIESSMQRIGDLVMAVMTYSSGSDNREAIEIKNSFRSAWLIVHHKFKQKNITVEKSYGEGMPLVKAPGLAQVWTNLLDNAADAVPESGGRVRIRTWAEGETAIVEIEDNGPGIAEENQKLIFQPFFTTKPQGMGTGLGLDIVSRIIRNAGGTIAVESKPGETVFRITLPTVSRVVVLEQQAGNQHA